ncbi:tyrosine-type recombinase/integrase [Nostoc sp. XA010]|uniref:tyrosine-type recombinase/integrase n=1 Tax=Nostoc sp. XA010 TaxID=2780407 RepID=UPI0035A92FA5
MFLPNIITKDEVFAIIQKLYGVHQLLIKLLYGTGFRLNEALNLRVKDDVKTTMIYTHVLNRGGKAVRSPLDC